MSLAVGSQVGPYMVVGPLGAGGMGEVWRARDPRLGRDVAIKVLSVELSRDPERRARFERECRLLASLSHPHIAAVMGLEDAGGTPALVMELVEGPTLGALIAQRGPFDVGEALGLARQIAEAVEYAHERGIVHRDLKPGNVKLTPDGAVKVLDFGLAKALAADEPASTNPELTQSPTMTAGTHVGVLLGTAAYMSPEQARGKAVDRRADIWAFGVMLAEMLTGKRLFDGETVSDTIARILERQPDWSTLPARTPARVRELLRRCLEKDARQRLRDIGDARLELESASQALAAGVSDAPAEVAAASARGRAWLPVAVALVALAAGWLGRGVLAPRRTESLRVSVVAPDNLVLTAMALGRGSKLELFASGALRDAHGVGPSTVFHRALDDFAWNEVPGTRGKTSWDLSLDGRWLYCVRPTAEGSREQELVRVPLDGSAPAARLRDWDESFGSWELLPSGDIACVERGNKRFARIVPGAAGAPKWRDIVFGGPIPNLSMEESLPDDRAVLVKVGVFGAKSWVESVGILELDSGKLTVLEENTGSPALLPDGTLLMTRQGALLAARFDMKRHRLASAPVPVLDGLRTESAWQHADVRATRRGDLGLLFGDVDAEHRSLALARPDGRVEPFGTVMRAFEEEPAISPDGRYALSTEVLPGTARFALAVVERGSADVRHLAQQVGEDCREPCVSRDGRRIAWARQGSDSSTGLFVQPLSGGPARRLLATGKVSTLVVPDDWYPGDDKLLVTYGSAASPGKICRVANLDGAAEVSDVVAEHYPVYGGAISPDGARIAYTSEEGGIAEIVVARLGPDGRAGPSVRVSRGFGLHPQWIEGGRTLLWGDRSRRIMAASVSPVLEVSSPRVHVDLAGLMTRPQDFAALADGSLLFTRRAEGEGEVRRYDILLGFAEQMKKRR